MTGIFQLYYSGNRFQVKVRMKRNKKTRVTLGW